jgi:hypothetical protein
MQFKKHMPITETTTVASCEFFKIPNSDDDIFKGSLLQNLFLLGVSWYLLCFILHRFWTSKSEIMKPPRHSKQFLR